jgi:hypothetical protein
MISYLPFPPCGFGPAAHSSGLPTGMLHGRLLMPPLEFLPFHE